MIGVDEDSGVRSLGSTLGIALVGTVVNCTFARVLPTHLPPVAHRFPARLLQAATSQQALLSPAYRRALTQGLVQGAVQRAGARVPSGPLHARVIATLTTRLAAQISPALDQIFAATRIALASAIAQGFVVALLICGCALVVGLCVTDLPLRERGPGATADAPQ